VASIPLMPTEAAVQSVAHNVDPGFRGEARWRNSLLRRGFIVYDGPFARLRRPAKAA
jgi:hypothetical protein